MKRRRPPSPLLAVIAMCWLLIAPMSRSLAAAPDSGRWGPQQIPYLNGVVCDSDAGSTALVAWPSAATSTPTFALGSINALADGDVGVPASAATTSLPATSDATGRSPDELAALAYLLERYGNADQAAVVGEVAALVAADAASDTCLAQGTGGVDSADAAALWREALRRAGPYTVEVTPQDQQITLGSPATLRARVVSAAGVGVPGLSVTLSSTEPTAVITPATAVTDAAGQVTSTMLLPADSTATQVGLTATVGASSGLIEMTEPDAVPLVGVAPAQQWRGQATVPVDVTADPVVVAGTTRNLVLPGTTVQTRVEVSGMHGHVGAASLSLLGPVPFVRDKGCSGYGAANWATGGEQAVQQTPIAATIAVRGDGTYQAAPLILSSAGCYLLRAAVNTTNAQPNVTANSVDGADQLITVPPLQVTQSSTGHGVATAGPLTTQVQVAGGTSALLDDVDGTVRGPREPPQTGCPSSGWQLSPIAAALTPVAGAPARSVTLTSPPLTRADCYAFAVTATVVLPGLGTIPITLAPSGSTATLILDPIVSATGLSTSAVHPGGRLSATVTVFQTLEVPGQLRLKLARQSYTVQGCYGLNWSATDLMPLAANAPVTSTTGDGTYTVLSPPVPSQGCWTVEPVLTLAANPAARADGPPEPFSMVAFTVTPRPPAPPQADVAIKYAHNAARLTTTAVSTLVLLVGALAFSVIIARRNDLDD